MELYLKYRPQSFKDVLGNTQQISALQKMIKSDEPSHVYLLSGTHGIGKTTLARICAKELGAKDIAITELNFSQATGKADAEELITSAKYRPIAGEVSIFICDEFHRLSPQGQDSLLKLLEDGCPPYAYFFICTTEKHKVRPAIRSRAFDVVLKPLAKKTVEKLVKKIALKEKLNIDDEVLEEIAITSGGSARDAIQLLEKASLLNTTEDMLKALESGLNEEGDVFKLYLKLLDKNAKWKEISEILGELRGESEPESIRYAILNMAGNALLKKADHRNAVIIDTFEDSFLDGGFPSLVLACYKLNKG